LGTIRISVPQKQRIIGKPPLLFESSRLPIMLVDMRFSFSLTSRRQGDYKAIFPKTKYA
jgi:hypothetical protein